MFKHPEQPLLVSPALASQYGVEGALLLGIIEQVRQINGRDDVDLSMRALEQRCPFWSRAQIDSLLRALSSKQCFALAFKGDVIRIVMNTESTSIAEPHPVNVPAVSPTVTPEPNIQVPDHTPARAQAPSFGGGWRRTPNELEEIFEAAERKKKLLVRMEVSWRPDDAFYQQLTQQGIEPKFANDCLDEFTLYYLDKQESQSIWNQKLLAWVKRAWRDKEGRSARQERTHEPSQSGGHNEKNRRDSRENRKRVTAAVMDLKNLDW